jgi:hypothetical protein
VYLSLFSIIQYKFDKINESHDGRGTIRLASGLLDKAPLADEEASWRMKRDYLSPYYNTTTFNNNINNFKIRI